MSHRAVSLRRNESPDYLGDFRKVATLDEPCRRQPTQRLRDRRRFVRRNILWSTRVVAVLQAGCHEIS
jgi:hypothetical protein